MTGGPPDYLAGVRNGTWLDAQDFSGHREARELLDDGRCSAPCLLAREPGSERDCQCRCRGRYHGALAAALVPVAELDAGPWHPWFAPELLDELAPVTASEAARSRLYATAGQSCEPFVSVQKWRNGTWFVHFDGKPAQYETDLRSQATWTLRALMAALREAGRIDHGHLQGRRVFIAEGVRTQTEAQVIGALVRELFASNLDGTWFALNSLHERGYGPEPRYRGQAVPD